MSQWGEVRRSSTVKGKSEPELEYVRVELTPEERDRIITALKKQMQTPTIQDLIQRLELAEKVALPFTRPIPWEIMEAWERLGYSLIDQIFDGAKLRQPPGGGE